MTSNPRLTACIIARDEEAQLLGCLASVAFCDEVVVVDSGSTDRTREIARAAGARVIEQPWLGFAAQRNVALEAARGTWVLEIDADERVTPGLQEEILAWLTDPPTGVTLAAMPRREQIGDRMLGPAAKYPNYCHRLVLRAAHRHDTARMVHEGLVPDGPVHPFDHDLVHHVATGWGELTSDALRYARLEAAQLDAAATPWELVEGAVVRPVVKVGYRLVVDGGWRDGAAGLGIILVHCASDAVVWALHAADADDRRDRSGGRRPEHYGSRRWPRGVPRVLAVGLGCRAAAAAAAWARVAAADGLDATVLTDHPGAVDGVRTRALPTSGPVSLVRGLDAEEQLRTIDAIVPFGRRARRLMRVVPTPLAGAVAPAAATPSPAALTGQVLAARKVARA